jgi:hypothetical protein
MRDYIGALECRWVIECDFWCDTVDDDIDDVECRFIVCDSLYDTNDSEDVDDSDDADDADDDNDDSDFFDDIYDDDNFIIFYPSLHLSHYITALVLLIVYNCLNR